jgi:hypothetical protein
MELYSCRWGPRSTSAALPASFNESAIGPIPSYSELEQRAEWHGVSFIYFEQHNVAAIDL